MALRKDAPARLVTRRASLALKAGDIADDGTFSGYGSIFGEVDTYGDAVVPGAFKASLARHAADARMPALLWQHDTACPIGIWTKIGEDKKGLWCEGRLILDVAQAREAHALLKAGAVTGLSIGFAVEAAEWASPDGFEEKFGWYPAQTANNNQVRLLKEIDLWEISLVTFPACGPARVADVKKVVAPKPDFRPLSTALARRGRAIASLAAAR